MNLRDKAPELLEIAADLRRLQKILGADQGMEAILSGGSVLTLIGYDWDGARRRHSWTCTTERHTSGNRDNRIERQAAAARNGRLFFYNSTVCYTTRQQSAGFIAEIIHRRRRAA